MLPLQQIKEWVETDLPALAQDHHASQVFSTVALEKMTELGILAPFIPAVFSGAGASYRQTLHCHDLVGSQCAAARTLLTVNGMVARAILRFGSNGQKARLLPELANGRTIGCFALTEERSGSDADDVQVSATKAGDGWRISGVKKWISMGEMADICLVFARDGEAISAFLVELTPAMVAPVRDLAVVRGGMMADLTFDNAPGERIGPEGAGLLFVLQDALSFGRLSVAAGSLGAARACHKRAAEEVRTRRGGADPLIEKQLVAGQIGDMAVRLHAADLVLSDAARAYDAGARDAMTRACAAKLLASQTCADVSTSALHLMGARGLSDDALVSRHFRDAQAWRLIEGSDEILKLVIADSFAELTRGPSWTTNETAT